MVPLAPSAGRRGWRWPCAEAARQSDALVSAIDDTDAVRNAFADLRYWMTDLAVSLLTLSESIADRARQRLHDRLSVLAAREPEIAATIGSEVSQFDAAASRAVDAYTQDQRVVGNSLTAQARQHGVRVDALLSQLEDQLAARAHEARNQAGARTAVAVRVSFAVVAVAILLGTLLTILVLSSILVPLRRLVQAVDGVGRGDVDVALPPARSDEMGAMIRALALLRESQRERLRLAAEAESRRQILAEAIASIEEGFALYDAQDRLVLHNAAFIALPSLRLAGLPGEG